MMKYQYTCPACGATHIAQRRSRYNWHGTKGPWVMAWCPASRSETAELQRNAQRTEEPIAFFTRGVVNLVDQDFDDLDADTVALLRTYGKRVERSGSIAEQVLAETLY